MGEPANIAVYPQLSLEVKITTAVVYILVLISGLIGNLLVIASVLWNRRMQGVTNIFITLLALGDLLIVCFCMPWTISSAFIFRTWMYGNLWCGVVLVCQAWGNYISALTLTAMAFERYFVVLHPMKAKIAWKRGTALKMCLVIVVVSFAFSIPRAIFGGVTLIPIGNNTVNSSWNSTMSGPNNDKADNSSDKLVQPTSFVGVCWVLNPSLSHKILVYIRVVGLYFIPIIIMSVLYGKVGWYIHTQSTKSMVVASSQKIIQARKRVIKMLFAMVAVYILFWLCFNVYLLLGTTDRLATVRKSNWYSITQFFATLFIYLSCICNPIMYTFMSSDFRRSFRDILCRLGKRKEEKYTTSSSVNTVSATSASS